MAKWSAMTNVLGLFISAASVVAAVSNVCRILLVLIVLVGTLGILFLMRCFSALHKARLESIDELKQDQVATPDELRHSAMNRGGDVAREFSKAEWVASICLTVCGILFCVYAVMSAYQIASPLPEG